VSEGLEFPFQLPFCPTDFHALKVRLATLAHSERRLHFAPRARKAPTPRKDNRVLWKLGRRCFRQTRSQRPSAVFAAGRLGGKFAGRLDRSQYGKTLRKGADPAVATPRRLLDGGVKLIRPGKTEAGSAGTQPCRGITRWAHRADEGGACGLVLCAPFRNLKLRIWLHQPHRTIAPHALKVPDAKRRNVENRRTSLSR